MKTFVLTFILNARLFLLLVCTLLYVIHSQIVFSLYMIVSYRASLRWLENHFQKQSRILCRLTAMMMNVKFSFPHSLKATSRGGNFLLVANHQSILDILALYMLFPASVRFVAKKSLGRGVPYISKVIRVHRNALIDRSSGSATIGIIRELARRCRRENRTLAIFPEGTRSRSGLVLPFKSSAVRASLMDGPMDMLVIALEGGIFLPKFFYAPLTAHRRYFKMKELALFENVNKKQAAEYLEKARDLIEAQLIEWRTEAGIIPPMGLGILQNPPQRAR